MYLDPYFKYCIVFVLISNLISLPEQGVSKSRTLSIAISLIKLRPIVRSSDTKDTHVKYQSFSTHYSNVMNKVKVFKK